MINRKIAFVALLAAVSAPSALAAEVITSDGRAGGAFWGQPSIASSTVQPPSRIAFVVREVNPSDGRPGGAFWGSATAVRQELTATGERFVGTSQTGNTRPLSSLEENNP